MVHTTAGVLAAFETGCGTRGATCLPAWTAYTEDEDGSPPSVVEGVIYVNAGNDRMLAFERLFFWPVRSRMDRAGHVVRTAPIAGRSRGRERLRLDGPRH